MDVETDDNFHGFYLLFRVIEQTHTVIIILLTLQLINSMLINHLNRWLPIMAMLII